jgi:FkbM family methyltransferase
MYLDPAQYIDREIVRCGVWEPAIRAVLHACLRHGDAFIDIGAHKGYLTSVAAQLVGPTGLVVSVDPDPRAFDALLDNVRRNGFTQVQPRQVALGADEGLISLCLTTTLGNTSSFPNRIALREVIQTLQVPCTTLDRLLTQIPLAPRPLPIVKIDAEGAEPQIWKGMQGLIKTYRPILVLEINYASFRAAGISVTDFERELELSGYTFYEPVVHRRRLRLVPASIAQERELLVDVLAVPRGHERIGLLT